MIEISGDKAFVEGKQIKLGKFITKEDFRAYLVKEAKNNRKYTCTETHCPLAEATGYVVDGNHYGIIAVDGDVFGPTKPLPAWAVEFVDNFDHADDFPGLTKPKNAKRALFVLDNAEKMNNYWNNHFEEVNR